MDTYKCLDCDSRVEIDPDEEVDIECPDCGGSSLVQVFGILAQTDGPA
ncbi:MAG: hypothetical protein ACRKGH_06575 [Dehalogenimonas sp.]